jgi:hypothetical protein
VAEGGGLLMRAPPCATVPSRPESSDFLPLAPPCRGVSSRLILSDATASGANSGAKDMATAHPPRLIT